MANLYYNPEDFGLTVVGEIEWCEESYEFDLTTVWRDADSFYYASDAGCSCPSPFEDLRGVNDLERADSMAALRAHLEGQIENREGTYSFIGREAATQKVLRLLDRARTS